MRLTAFDWNCCNTSRSDFSAAELAPALAPLLARFEALESKNKALRAKLAAKGD
jgi:uncharacterized protein